MERKLSLVFLLHYSFLLVSCGYDSREDCVLGEMKNQQASMQSAANKVCERKFPYEKRIYSYGETLNIAWGTSFPEKVTIEVKHNETGYSITRAKMKFSMKSCEKSTHKDFNSYLSFKLDSNDKGVASYSKAAFLQCMKPDSIFGIIK